MLWSALVLLIGLLALAVPVAAGHPMRRTSALQSI